MTDLIEMYRLQLLEIAIFRDTTIKSYIRSIYEYFEYAKNVYNIDPVQSRIHHINDWLLYLKQNEYGEHYMKTCKASLNRFFEYLLNLGKIKKNPAKKTFPIKKIKSDLNKPVSKETVFSLLDTFDRSIWLENRNYTIIAALWALGLRVNELTRLKVGDFNKDFDVNNTTGLLKIHGKGRKQRSLFVVEKLYECFVEYLSMDDSPKNKKHYLFCKKDKRRLTNSQVRSIIREAVKKAGVKERVTPHVLRHTFATDMYEAGVPIEAIKDMLGHDSVSETSLYVHVSDKLQEKVLENINLSGE